MLGNILCNILPIAHLWVSMFLYNTMQHDWKKQQQAAYLDFICSTLVSEDREKNKKNTRNLVCCILLCMVRRRSHQVFRVWGTGECTTAHSREPRLSRLSRSATPRLHRQCEQTQRSDRLLLLCSAAAYLSRWLTSCKTKPLDYCPPPSLARQA